MTLDDLRAANEQLGAEFGIDPDEVLGEIMVLLDRDDRYPETPANCVVFSHEGVDGAHHAFLETPGRALHESPVISVAPMEAEWSCAGETLREFIELQCHFTEACLAEDEPANPEEGATRSRGLKIIAALRARFGLHPRPDYEERIAELDRMYLLQLRIDPEILLGQPDDHPMRSMAH